MSRPLIGISSCLLGNNVRYDGGNKLNRYLHDDLSMLVEYLPVCPEAECGLGIPRPAIRLYSLPGDIRMMTATDHTDVTPQLTSWIHTKLDELAARPLCGFIFKSKSPSCGIRSIPVHDIEEAVQSQSSGQFARAFMERFPQLPVSDERELTVPGAGRTFLKRIQEIFTSF